MESPCTSSRRTPRSSAAWRPSAARGIRPRCWSRGPASRTRARPARRASLFAPCTRSARRAGGARGRPPRRRTRPHTTPRPRPQAPGCPAPLRPTPAGACAACQTRRSRLQGPATTAGQAGAPGGSGGSGSRASRGRRLRGRPEPALGTRRRAGAARRPRQQGPGRPLCSAAPPRPPSTRLPPRAARRPRACARPRPRASGSPPDRTAPRPRFRSFYIERPSSPAPAAGHRLGRGARVAGTSAAAERGAAQEGRQACRCPPDGRRAAHLLAAGPPGVIHADAAPQPHSVQPAAMPLALAHGRGAAGDPVRVRQPQQADHPPMRYCTTPAVTRVLGKLSSPSPAAPIASASS